MEVPEKPSLSELVSQRDTLQREARRCKLLNKSAEGRAHKRHIAAINALLRLMTQP